MKGSSGTLAGGNFVRQEVTASGQLGKVLGSANVRDGVQAAMESASDHTFPADGTPKCYQGNGGTNPRNGSGQPTGDLSSGIAAELCGTGHENTRSKYRSACCGHGDDADMISTVGVRTNSADERFSRFIARSTR